MREAVTHDPDLLSRYGQPHDEDPRMDSSTGSTPVRFSLPLGICLVLCLHVRKWLILGACILCLS